MLIDADWCWLILIYADWFWLMLNQVFFFRSIPLEFLRSFFIITIRCFILHPNQMPVNPIQSTLNTIYNIHPCMTCYFFSTYGMHVCKQSWASGWWRNRRQTNDAPVANFPHHWGKLATQNFLPNQRLFTKAKQKLSFKQNTDYKDITCSLKVEMDRNEEYCRHKQSLIFTHLSTLISTAFSLE